MQRLHTRSRTLLGAVATAAVLALPTTAFADCAKTVSTAAFKGSIAQWYPQQCYSSALSKLGPDVNTYSPNVPANIRSAMRRDRTHKVKLTIAWLPKNKARVTANVKLKSSIQIRKGAKILAKGSISSKTTVLKLRKTGGKLTGALIWTLGKKQLTVTAPITLAKVAKKK
ncbi:MAG TPA: hypothetical protein VFD90_12815 [Gaiellales bacterium]|jgi:hypothetical protein|nr:hypothetical protein [Gaiellales bacterium]